MWPSEAWASRLFNWANIALICSLAVGVVSTALLVWMGNIKEAYGRITQQNFELELSKQQERTARAEVEAADAKKIAGGFEIAISDAKAAQQQVEIKLAEQQERAAIAERTLLQLKESMKERMISAQQKQELIKALAKGPKGNVEIWWLSGEPDSYGLALQIKGILAASGWPEATERLAVGGTGEGLFILVRDVNNAPLYAGTLQHAFDSVGLPLQAAPKPELPDNLVQIFIGRRRIVE